MNTLAPPYFAASRFERKTIFLPSGEKRMGDYKFCQRFGWRDNAVSLVIRSNFKSDLKLGNKMMVYDCMDAGRVKAFFGRLFI